MTENQFYAAVKAACLAEGIPDEDRGMVEMTCLCNAYDAPADQLWDRAHDTLEWFIATGDLVAASRNER